MVSWLHGLYVVSDHVITVSANERRCHICSIFSHWLRSCSHVLRKYIERGLIRDWCLLLLHTEIQDRAYIDLHVWKIVNDDHIVLIKQNSNLNDGLCTIWWHYLNYWLRSSKSDSYQPYRNIENTLKSKVKLNSVWKMDVYLSLSTYMLCCTHCVMIFEVNMSLVWEWCALPHICQFSGRHCCGMTVWWIASGDGEILSNVWWRLSNAFDESINIFQPLHPS